MNPHSLVRKGAKEVGFPRLRYYQKYFSNILLDAINWADDRDRMELQTSQGLSINASAYATVVDIMGFVDR